VQPLERHTAVDKLHRRARLIVRRGMDRSSVLAVMGAASVVAFIFHATKRRRKTTPSAPSNQRETEVEEVPAYSLLTELLHDDAVLDVVRLMPAAAAARLARVSWLAHGRISDPDVAQWCADSRKRLLRRRNVAGDLPLAHTSGERWTLERLHLCENPPRFPHILFEFASDAIEDAASSEVAKVAKLLRRHPKLRIRIQGAA
jgi:hypothetical protein